MGKQPFSAPKPRSLPTSTGTVDVSQTLASWQSQLNPGVKNTAPQATPVNFKVTNSRGGLTLAWSPVSGADGYEILKSQNGSFTDDLQVLAVPGANASSYFDGTGGNALTAHYRIRTTSGTARNPQSQRGPESGTIGHTSIDSLDTATVPVTKFDNYTSDATRSKARFGNYGGASRTSPLGKTGGSFSGSGVAGGSGTSGGTITKGSTSFASIGDGTNNNANMVVGSGAQIIPDTTNPGIIAATNLETIPITTNLPNDKDGLQYVAANGDLEYLPTPRTLAKVTHQFLDSYSAATGLLTQSQPADADLSVTDITTNNVSTTAHGFAPKAPNDATKYLDGTAVYSVPPYPVISVFGRTGAVVAVAGDYTWDKLGNAAGALTLANAGNATTFNQTSAVTWTWANTTAATSGTSQSSPILSVTGTYWTGAASATDKWTIQDVVANGTNGTSELKILHTGSTGSAIVDVALVALASGTGGPFVTGGLGFDGTKATAASAPAILGAMAANIFALVPSSSTSVNQTNALRFYTNAGTTSAQFSWDILCNHNSGGNASFIIQAEQGVVGQSMGFYCAMGTSTIAPGITLGGNGGNNGQNFSATSGAQVGVSVGTGIAGIGDVRFNPASGTANFVGLQVKPVINQTGTASGSYTGLLVNAVETALLGSTNKLLDLQSGATGGVSRFSVDNSGQVTESTANGAQWVIGQASELLTLSTVGTTTDTVANLLPANAIIESVVARVTTTITTATNWELGDATTPGRFSAPNSTLVAGTTQVGLVHVDQTGAAGPRQTAAAKVRVTVTGTPAGGVIRITVFYRQFVAPTS